MKIHSLSASKIKSYKMCEFKYYLEYHLFRDTRTTFAAEQGNMIHVIFEKLGQDVRDGVPKEESHMFKNWHEEILYAYQEEGLWTLSPQAHTRTRDCMNCPFHKDGVCTIANKNLDDFDGCPKQEYEDAVWLAEQVINNDDILWPLDQKVIDVENRFQLLIPDGDEEIKVNGIIDVVTELDDNTIEIVDYKTGKYVQSYNECLKDPQLLIYHLAARNKWRDYENIMISIYYLRKKPLTLSFGKNDEEGTENALKHYFHVIKNNESPKRRADIKSWGGEPNYDYVCQKMCDIALCECEFAKFKENGHKILPAPENPERHRTQWLKHLMEGSQKDAAFKEITNVPEEKMSPGGIFTEGESEDNGEKGSGELETGKNDQGSSDSDTT